MFHLFYATESFNNFQHYFLHLSSSNNNKKAKIRLLYPIWPCTCTSTHLHFLSVQLKVSLLNLDYSDCELNEDKGSLYFCLFFK